MKKLLNLTLIIIIILSFTSCSSTSNEPSKETNTNNTTSTAEPTPTPQDTFTVGETAVFQDLKITALEMKETYGNTYFKAEAGKIYVGIKLEIENISTIDQSMSTLLLFDAYVDDIKSSYDFTAGINFDEGTLDGTISPGKKMVGWYAISANENWSEIELQIKSNLLTNGKAKFLITK